MTNEEALSILHCPDTVGGLYSEKYGEALGMAMEALKREPCEDCISRQAAIEAMKELIISDIEEYHQNNQAVNNCIATVWELPSVTPKRARGKWMTEHNKGYVQCSNCHKRVPFCKRSNFCPNCGTDMRGEEE